MTLSAVNGLDPHIRLPGFANAPTDTSATEMFELSIDAPLPSEELCALTIDLAEKVAAHLGGS